MDMGNLVLTTVRLAGGGHVGNDADADDGHLSGSEAESVAFSPAGPTASHALHAHNYVSQVLPGTPTTAAVHARTASRRCGISSARLAVHSARPLRQATHSPCFHRLGETASREAIPMPHAPAPCASHSWQLMNADPHEWHAAQRWQQARDEAAGSSQLQASAAHAGVGEAGPCPLDYYVYHRPSPTQNQSSAAPALAVLLPTAAAAAPSSDEMIPVPSVPAPPLQAPPHPMLHSVHPALQPVSPVYKLTCLTHADNERGGQEQQPRP